MPLTMESPSKERAILNIKLTQAKHKKIVTNLLPAHAISGCDTVPCHLFFFFFFIFFFLLLHKIYSIHESNNIHTYNKHSKNKRHYNNGLL